MPSFPSSTPCCPSRSRFTTQRLDPFTTLSSLLVHEFYPVHQASPTAFLYPYTYRIHMHVYTTYSPVDLSCFPPWIHVHPRFPLTPFETSIIIIITSYPTSLCLHSTHSWYTPLLHQLSICISRFLAWLLVHSSSPADPSVKFTSTLSHEFISPTRHRFFTPTTACVSYPRY